jgi:hypothetical protein
MTKTTNTYTLASELRLHGNLTGKGFLLLLLRDYARLVCGKAPLPNGNNCGTDSNPPSISTPKRTTISLSLSLSLSLALRVCAPRLAICRLSVWVPGLNKRGDVDSPNLRLRLGNFPIPFTIASSLLIEF